MAGVVKHKLGRNGLSSVLEHKSLRGLYLAFKAWNKRGVTVKQLFIVQTGVSWWFRNLGNLSEWTSPLNWGLLRTLASGRVSEQYAVYELGDS